MHYQTKHVLERVGDNYCSLTDNAAYVPAEGLGESYKPDQGLKTALDELFEGGADLAFEMDFGWDDEGGNCYQAFIIKKEFITEYGDAFVDVNDPTFPAKWYAAHPEQYWILWQGPY